MSATQEAHTDARDLRSKDDALVATEHLTKYFPITKGIIFQKEVARVHAVEDVTFSIYPGETVGLVGESGCGKSTCARLVTRLLEPTSGTIWFDGRDITGLKRRGMRPIRRGRE